MIYESPWDKETSEKYRQRIEGKLVEEDGHRIYCGSKDGHGLFIHIGWKTYRVQRVYWILTKGVIKEPFRVLHQCERFDCLLHLSLGRIGSNKRGKKYKKLYQRIGGLK